MTWTFGHNIAVHVEPVIQGDQLEKREESLAEVTKPCRSHFIKQPPTYHCKHVYKTSG